MKNHIHIAIILALLFAIFSCSEEKVKTSIIEPCIYYAGDTMTTYNFFFYPDVNDVELSILVKIGGKLTDTDRTFLVEPVITGEGVEGLDFELKREQIVPAKESAVFIPLKLMRRAEMEGKTFEIKILLRKNDNFSLNLPWIINARGDTLQRHYFVVKCQAELAPPPLWVAPFSNYAGYWSIPKFNEMNKLWETTIDDWANKSTKLSRYQMNYLIVFANYLNRMAALGPEFAIKDPSKASTRGYMTIKGYSYLGITPTVIPADFPTTEEWEGNAQ